MKQKKLIKLLRAAADALEGSAPPPKTNIEMVYVQSGTFTMGCSKEQGTGCCAGDELPSHSVSLGDFRIGKYQVTQAQWKAVMGNNPSHFQGCDNCPVEQVTWDDVQVFIEKLNAQTGKQYRLPTEAEWEFAARGGNKSRGYKYAGGNDLDAVAWHKGNSGYKTQPVGGKAPNELGIYDMSGNVWEWCSDWYGTYTAASKTNPKGAVSGNNKVLRGGSWDYIAPWCRVSYRHVGKPGYRISDVGFRLVLIS